MLGSAAVPTLPTAIEVVFAMMLILGGSLGASIEQDIRALLPEAAASLVRSSIILLKRDDRAEVLSWFTGEYLNIRSKGGSGVGISMTFLVIVIHRAVITRLDFRIKSKK